MFSPSNKIYGEVGRAKDLSAPRYRLPFAAESHIGIHSSIKSALTLDAEPHNILIWVCS